MKDNVFTEEGGARKAVPKVLLVLTDGRSQDDVIKVSKEMQREGQSSGFSSGFQLVDASGPVHSGVGCYFMASPPFKATSCSPSVLLMLITVSW